MAPNESLQAYMEMGGHGVFVWASYAVALGAIGGLIALTLRAMRRAEAQVDAGRRDRRTLAPDAVMPDATMPAGAPTDTPREVAG